mmetsp:Transcript_4890/g.9325  ORF Transcript_4890/g.9325 Transcript_4890/m.9325 type:complete len:81 (-) Transcript_4890:2076-2318(-)
MKWKKLKDLPRPALSLWELLSRCVAVGSCFEGVAKGYNNTDPLMGIGPRVCYRPGREPAFLDRRPQLDGDRVDMSSWANV